MMTQQKRMKRSGIRSRSALLLVVSASILLSGPTLVTAAFDPILSVEGTHTPAPFDELFPPGATTFDGAIDGMVDAVDQSRVALHMQTLEDFGTRYSLSEEIEAVADWLFETMSGFGLEVRRQEFDFYGYPRENIIATIPGRSRPEEYVVIGAHYDSISDDPYVSAPGADDNASGTAAVLEAARILADYEFERTVEFVAFACEEGTGMGGRTYVLDLWQSDVEVIGCFNFDMIAWPGADPAPPDLVIDTNVQSRYLAAILRDAALHYLPLDLEPVISDKPFGGSDHVAFWGRYYAAVMGIESIPYTEEFNPNWHTTNDLVSNCDIVYATHVIQAAVAALAVTGLPVGEPWPGIVTGPGPAQDNPPLVRVYHADTPAYPMHEFHAYGPQHYGVNVSCGDVNGDGSSEIITGAGPGAVFGPHVRGFTTDGTPLPGLSFLAYGTNKYGVNAATADIDGDGIDEIITGAGPGAVFGPHVRAFNYDGGPIEPIDGVSYFAYGTPKWGVNVAAGDVDGDGFDEIITGAGPGAVYGPHVRGWNVDGGTVGPMPSVSFLAYGTHKWGVNVCCGDVDGDGIDEIVTGPGPGAVFSTHVRGWNCDGGGVVPLPGLSFLAWPPSEVHYGARVAAGAVREPAARARMIVGCGPDPTAATPIKVFLYDSQNVTEEFVFSAFPEEFTQGATVAGGRF